jgi:hypothetical protein
MEKNIEQEENRLLDMRTAKYFAQEDRRILDRKPEKYWRTTEHILVILA